MSFEYLFNFLPCLKKQRDERDEKKARAFFQKNGASEDQFSISLVAVVSWPFAITGDTVRVSIGAQFVQFKIGDTLVVQNYFPSSPRGHNHQAFSEVTQKAVGVSCGVWYGSSVFAVANEFYSHISFRALFVCVCFFQAHSLGMLFVHM